MISAVIPSYRSPKYLDICLHSLLDGQVNDNEIIVVIDGFVEESQWVIDKYKNKVGFIEFPENRGMQQALNIGVYNASNEKILIVNDDNVFPYQWDKVLEQYDVTDTIITSNQIEPTGPGMFNFPVKDFGRNAIDFDYGDFVNYEQSIRKDEDTPDGEIFPFMISKRNYMVVGGFDILYNSPFICDWDFFLKLEMLGLEFIRSHRLYFYHFGSKATKNRDTEKRDESMFRSGEAEAYQMFEYKWGFRPNNGLNNSKKPNGLIRGVDYK
jgi:glycosyltransferase involved in cell wall biosynthesis